MRDFSYLFDPFEVKLLAGEFSNPESVFLSISSAIGVGSWVFFGSFFSMPAATKLFGVKN
jgi:hypothetical protein